MRLLKFFAKSTKEEAGEGSENDKKNLLSQTRCKCGWPQRYFGSIIWNSLPIEIREDLILWSVTKIKHNGNEWPVHVQSGKVTKVEYY